MNDPVGHPNTNFPGYGLFWLANSISSTLIGLTNRDTQRKAHERGLEFQKELIRSRELIEDEKIAEEIAFKRRLMVLGRQYRQIESSAAFDTQLQLSEIKYFLDHHWPLDKSLPTVIFTEVQNNMSGNSFDNRLNVILLHAPFLPQKKFNGGANDGDDSIYKQLEHAIAAKDIPFIGDVHYRKDAHSCDGVIQYDLKSGNATLMNIHFLMSQLPTLVISPRFANGKMLFIGAVWEPQAARPLIRNLFSIDHNPEEALNSDEYCTHQKNLFHSAVSTIIGSVRDSYMLLTEGKRPTFHFMLDDVGHSKMKEIVLDNQQLLNFVRSEQQSMIDALDGKRFPKVFEVYHPEDIASMIKFINETRI